MRKFQLFLFIFLFFTAPLVQAQRDFTDVEIKAIPVAGSIYMLEGQGGNIGACVGEDGVLLIDDQFAPLADKIRKALKDLGEEKVAFILNTHWHSDHTGGNEEFGVGGTIVAHTHVRDRLSTRQEVKLFNMVSEPKPKVALPDITFDDSLTIHFNNETIAMIHFPEGHTDGDSVVFFKESNVVHIGDYMFNGMYPFVDLDSGGSVQGYIKNVASLLEKIPQDAQIIPGHGALARWQDLKDFHAMLILTADIVNNAISDGKTLEEIQAAGFPDDIVEKWGQGFLKTDQWINIIYNSYSK